MFSPSLNRVLRSKCQFPASHNVPHRPSTASIIAVSERVLAPITQRRHSSSNTSCPPSGSRGASLQSNTHSKSEKKAAGRSGRARKGSPPAVNIPHVPPTHHLQESDVGLSSFFSLHRPISVTSSIPTATTEASFNAIFETRLRNNRKFADVIFALSNTVDHLETASQGAANGNVHVEIEPTRHLDGPPAIDMNAMLAQYRPFQAPPPPVPFNEPGSKKRKASTQRSRTPRERQGAQTKKWKTTIVVTEETDANGEKTYTAKTSPIVEIPTPPAPAVEDQNVKHEIVIRQPFLERMRRRQQRWEEYRDDRASKVRGDMILISVRRRRKLKMKKHKYKKLMKRTRNLRRKLDRT